MELAMVVSIAVSVMEKIGDLVKMEASSLVRKEMKSLESETETLTCFLKGAAEKEETNQRVLELEAEMEKTLDKAVDILDAFLSDVAHGKPIFSRFRSIFSSFRSCLLGRSRMARLRKLTIIRDQIRAFNKNLEISGINKVISVEGANLSRPDDLQPQLEGSGVGLKGDVEKLVPILVGRDQHQTCSHIAIVGMGGIGKTTLAKCVLSDQRVRTHFEASAWAYVGRNFQTRKVFQDILLQLVPGCEEEIKSFSNFQLLRQLYEVQLSNRFLIVLDDVWTKEDWTCLNLAFPSKKSASKILVTTRCREVADRIADRGISHRMRALTQDESWELFREKAFPGKYASNTLPFANQLNEIGHKIVEKCSGLPLAIVVIARLLGDKHTLKQWELVHQRMDWYARAELGSVGSLEISGVLSLSYDHLPYHLKPCFLYLGLFPEDSEIDSQLLCQLWIAEGLISSTTGKRQTKMDVARCYLDELIKRNMVQVQEEKSPTSTTFKTILLPDLMRDLCLSKAKEASFLKVMDCVTPKDQLKCSNPATPRLSLYSGKNEDRHVITLSKDNVHSLRSLLMFNSNQNPKDMALPSAVPSLTHLRSLLALHFDGFKFGTGRSLKVIGELTRLTYLGLSGCFLDELPSSTGKLVNLQSLDLRVQDSIRLPNILWKMIRLRHLYLPCRFCVRRDEKLRLDSLKNLETLENFDTTLCNANNLIKLSNLRLLHLTTEGNLGDLEEIANNLSTKLKCLPQSSLYVRRSLNCYSETRNSILGKLFECPTLYNLHIEGHISYLPQMISLSLNELVLSRTEIDEDPMQTLEKFPRLWILELNNDAFLGKEMICSASGFPQLRHLKLSNLQNIENLSIEKGAIPNLSNLSIERCKKLEVLHDGFNHLRSLKKLRITKCHLEPSIGGQGKLSDFKAVMPSNIRVSH